MGEGLDRTTRSLELLNNQQLLTQTWAKVVSVAVTQGAIWGKRCATHIETLVGRLLKNLDHATPRLKARLVMRNSWHSRTDELNRIVRYNKHDSFFICQVYT